MAEKFYFFNCLLDGKQFTIGKVIIYINIVGGSGMFLIKKKILSLFMIGLLLVMCMPQKSYANVSKLTKETILSLEKDKLLDCLRDEGLVLPQYYENHKEVAEKFVSYFTPLILNGKNRYKRSCI